MYRHIIILLALPTLIRSQTINGIPTCAVHPLAFLPPFPPIRHLPPSLTEQTQKECALSIIATSSDCPLNTQPCICAYLSAYASCVGESCNGTDSTRAVPVPLPYYIPEATISVASMGTCPAVAATNPVFGTLESGKTASAETTTMTTNEAGRAATTGEALGSEVTMTTITSSETRTSSSGTRSVALVTGMSTSAVPAKQTSTGAAGPLEGHRVLGVFGGGLGIVLGYRFFV
ncbi:uncharacterized protein K444DRAFT_617584 [Hyaloscypha bicolor E]|uniref:Uncharacterized protein n=1 Tax=Hyaloscypha bicolor E TaxID=1095630 RepID=A0A2J6SWG7_9HELO|nr:uncharacterized protein K444DRAFT_617584 [Hyaloscypha bicolor E]PMD55130.1 hypothetical protein K444DRAFT_617584 [Hyaloscypha bicolor E]